MKKNEYTTYSGGIRYYDSEKEGKEAVEDAEPNVARSPCNSPKKRGKSHVVLPLVSIATTAFSRAEGVQTFPEK